VAAQHSAALVDLRAASLGAVPRAAVFASYHGLAIVRGEAAWPGCLLCYDAALLCGPQATRPK